MSESEENNGSLEAKNEVKSKALEKLRKIYDSLGLYINLSNVELSAKELGSITCVLANIRHILKSDLPHRSDGHVREKLKTLLAFTSALDDKTTDHDRVFSLEEELEDLVTRFREMAAILNIKDSQ